MTTTDLSTSPRASLALPTDEVLEDYVGGGFSAAGSARRVPITPELLSTAGSCRLGFRAGNFIAWPSDAALEPAPWIIEHVAAPSSPDHPVATDASTAAAVLYAAADLMGYSVTRKEFLRRGGPDTIARIGELAEFRSAEEVPAA